VGPRAGLDEVEKRIFLILPELDIRRLGQVAVSIPDIIGFFK
jgi:hypothetical protein